MYTALLIVQIILSLSIVVAILLQAQGAGLGSTWGGGGETFHTRRGLETVIFYFTIIAILLFAILAMGVLLVS